MTPAATHRSPTPLPRLRKDLRIERAGVDAMGFVKIIVTDPVRGTYFQLGWPLSAALMSWRDVETVESLIDVAYQSYAAGLSPDDIKTLEHFLQTNQLTELDEGGSWHRTAARASAGRHSIAMMIMHNYLFFRIPLFRPEAMLARMLPALAAVYTARFWLTLSVVALIGLYLSLRQWPAILTGVSDSFRLQGLAIYAVVLLVLKAVHELGHGLTTVHYGCRVPSMGVAFMLGTPVLYTDTSDSWRLARRSERLAIVFAGIGAEMIVATLALLIWPFLPDGIFRQVCFSIVTSAILISVLINLNPFMRYDGYFALSDALRVPNLQDRAFELALWRLRETLFDLRRPPPEQLPRRLEITLIVYAVLTAIYRVILYIGIAAIVYHIGSKVLGIVLGLFEIAFFIAWPVWRELREWWRARHEIFAHRRIRLTALLPVAALLALCLPWMTTVEVPATLQARVDEPVHLPAAAVLLETHVVEGQHVQVGQVLFVAASPDFEHQLAKVRAEAAALEARLRRLHASDRERTERLMIESLYQRSQERAEAIERLQAELVVRAKIEGRIVDIDPDLSIGAWQDRKRPLARIASTAGTRARGILSDADLGRMVIGANARFIPDDISMPIQSLRLVELATASNGRLAEPVLAEKYGGTVPASDEKGELMLRHGWADVHFEADAPSPPQLVRGVIKVDATAISPLQLMFEQIARVLVREQGF